MYKKYLLGYVLGALLIRTEVHAQRLDSSGAWNVPYSGDISTAKVKNSSGTLVNIKDAISASGGGSYDTIITGSSTNVSATLSSLPSGSTITAESVSGLDKSSFPTDRGFVANFVGSSADSSGFFGDGNVAVGASNGKTLYRYVSKNTSYTASLFSQFVNQYSGDNTPYQKNVWLYSTTGVDSNFNTISNYKGNTSTLRLDMNSYSPSTGSYDIGVESNVYRHGQAWVWGNLSVVEDLGNTQVATNSIQSYSGEWDMSGFGNDAIASTYSPGSLRHGFLFSSWNSGGGFGTKWSASHSYSTGDAIEVTINGVLYSFVAIQSGTSGSSTPSFSVTTSADTITKADTANAITDGTVKWAFNGRLLMQIGSGVFISYQPDTTHSPDTGFPSDYRNSSWRIPVAFGSVFGSDAMIYNTAIDLSKTSYTTSTKVFLRTPKDTYLDLTGDGTTSGNNKHLFGYSSTDAAFEMKVNGGTVFGLTDSGVMTAETHFGYQNSFSDPDSGAARDAKFGHYGIAVLGGTKTDTLSLVGISKSTILGMTTVKEGMILLDSTDHQLVVYLNGKWYPLSVGTALSN